MSGQESVKCQTFVFEGNTPPIYLNESKFAQIIPDPASPTEEVSIRFLFYECLQITFPNNVLVRKLDMWLKFTVMRTARHPTEERGGVSRAH